MNEYLKLDLEPDEAAALRAIAAQITEGEDPIAFARTCASIDGSPIAKRAFASLADKMAKLKLEMMQPEGKPN